MPLVKEDVRRVQISLNGGGCGHAIVMTPEHYKVCRDEGRPFYCTVCGTCRKFVGELEADRLRRERDAALQREETLKAMRKNLEVALAKEQASKLRLKKRVTNGVCPCCTRSFQNVKRHIANKHPEYAEV